MSIPQDLLEREARVKLLQDKMVSAYSKNRLKKKLDKEYDELREEINFLLKDVSLKSYKLENDDRLSDLGIASLETQVVTKEMSKVIVDKFQKLVTPEKFKEAIEVNVTKAREILPELQWGECIIKYNGSPYVEIKASKI